MDKQRLGSSGALAFGLCFGLSLALGGAYGLTQPASASKAIAPAAQGVGYAGPEFCAGCHEELHTEWQVTRHAQAFSSPIFQQNWEEIGSQFSCLQCHTTGYDPAINTYAFEGVTCEACHGPGSKHVEAADELGDEPTEEQEKHVKSLIHGILPNVCIECHSRMKHKKHPQYDEE